ncbi:MAG: DUF1573 domain-containing protein [Bacillota bacterium]
MKDLLCDEFQEAVAQYLVRHRSILDVISKFQESNARVNRAVVKAVTNCGCLEIDAQKQQFTSKDLTELLATVDTHLGGKLCDECRETIEAELGNNLFYLVSLCNLLDLSLFDVLLKEHKRLETLGVFKLS